MDYPSFARIARVSWLYIALLALAVAVVVGAEWPRLGAGLETRLGVDARRRRERAKRKASLRVVQPYSHERILQLRNRQVVETANAAPSNLNEVDTAAWNAVRAKYPQLPVNSAGFKKCCSDTVLLWATDFAKEQHPELAAADKRGELRKAVDAVLVQWARVKKPAQSLSQRIWLG